MKASKRYRVSTKRPEVPTIAATETNRWQPWQKCTFGVALMLALIGTLWLARAAWLSHTGPGSLGENEVSSNNMKIAASGTAARTGQPNAAKSSASQTQDDALVGRTDELALTLNEGNRLLKLGKVDEAVAQYNRALQLNPDNEDVHFNLGIALARQGKLDEAIAQYREALKLMPDYAEVHNNLGNLLSRQGKLAEAAEEFRAALKIMPEHAAAHNNLGIVLARQQQNAEALKEFAEAARLMPDYVEAHFNLGTAYLADKRLAEAQAEFKTVLRLKPGFQPAEDLLKRMEATQGTNAAGVK